MPGILLNTFTLIISLNIFNIIIQLIDVKTAAWKALFTFPLLHLLRRGDFHSKFMELILTLLRLHSVLYTLVVCFLLSKLCE